MRKGALRMDFLLIFKTVLASTSAWWICVALLDSQMPFLAPWVAFLVMQPTVSSSLTSGFQTVIASGVGVLLSSAIGVFLGVEVWSYALALVLGMLGARIPGLRKEGATIATTAIFLLSTGFTEDVPALVDRMIEISIGVAIGVGVNLIVIPPLWDQQAASTVKSLRQQVADVLDQIGTEFSESWDSDRAHELSKTVNQMRRDLRQSWSTVEFAQNSRRRNPRALFHGTTGTRYEQVLISLDEAISHLRNLTRILASTSDSETLWDRQFRKKWSTIVQTTATLMSNPDANVEPAVQQLDDLAHAMVTEKQLPEEGWPLYGALITSVRSIASLIDDVSTATSDA